MNEVLEQKLDAAFGTQAELDAVCRALPKRSGPLSEVPKPTDGRLFGPLTTARRLVGIVLYAAFLSPLIDAVGNVLSYPR